MRLPACCICGNVSLSRSAPASGLLAVLRDNPISAYWRRIALRRQEVPLGQSFEPRHVDGSFSGLSVELFDVPGRSRSTLNGDAPRPFRPAGRHGRRGNERGRAPASLCIPGCAQMTGALKRRLAGASAVLFDGTLWRDDEMIRLGLGPKPGRRMGI